MMKVIQIISLRGFNSGLNHSGYSIGQIGWGIYERRFTSFPLKLFPNFQENSITSL